MEGRVKVHRKLCDNPIFSSLDLLWFFLHLLLKVNHKKNSFFLWLEKVTLEAWQCIVWQRKLALELKVNKDKINRMIKILSEEWILRHETTTKYTVITFVKRDYYQSNETPDGHDTGHQKDTKKTPADTNKNVKNIKNDNNEKENISDTIVSEEQSSLSEKTSFGNSDINEVFEIVKEFNQGITDDKQTWKSRWIWKYLIWKISAVNKVKDWTYSRQDYLRWVLIVVSKNQYHRHKISGVEKIYYNFAELVQIANSEYNRQQDSAVKSF